MEQITLEVPEEVLISLKETPEEFSRDLLMLAKDLERISLK